MRVIRRASLQSAPWQNGGGAAQEIIRVPASGDPFVWRLSVAEISAAGALSDFSGYARTVVLVKGEGIKFKFLDKHEHVLNRIGELFEFDGSLAMSAELLGGSCIGMSLITSHAIGAIDAQLHHLGRPLLIPESLSETLLIFSVAGTTVVEDARGELEILESCDAVVCAPSDASVTCRSSAHSLDSATIFVARICEPPVA